jgi:cytochrome P460
MILRVALACMCSLAFATGCSGQPPSVVQQAAADDANGAATEAKQKAMENAAAPAIHEAVRNYASLQLLTPKPVMVDLEVFLLCDSRAIESASTRARERSGPHALTAIRVFMSDSAAEAFRDSTTYPAGAVIVKEKHKGSDAALVTAHEPVAKPLAVAGMIKRAAGYDPAHGGWEYFYLADTGKLEHGRLASCIDCHRNAAGSDYVFGDWFQGESPRNR